MSKIAVQSESRDLPFLAPFPIFRRLREQWGEQGVALLESISGPARDLRASLIGFGPVLTVTVAGTAVRLTGRAPVVEHVGNQLREREPALVERAGDALRMREESDLWKVLRAIEGCFDSPPGSGTSFEFGFFGYLGYDVVRSVERLPLRIVAGNDQPTLVLTIFEGLLTFDLVGQRTSLRLNGAPGYWDRASLDDIAKMLATGSSAEPEPMATLARPVPRPLAVRPTMQREEYLEKVQRALEYIGVGDIYQVQLGHEIDVQSEVDPLDVYERLRVLNPSPYMYMLPAGELTLLGASPELFLKIDNELITMRPIAGTARRGRTREEDDELVRELKSNEKELAEHVMLVDLGRNDIGRVCEPRTLNVDELIVVEQYSHVNHLVSNVTGKLRRDVDAFDAIAATFPAGTMTGAPKIRAMEIIEELETKRRGAYAGAVGLIDFSGYVNTALCIRSTVYRNGWYSLRASAGTVADSIAENEWRETLHKMGATYLAITGQELTYESLSD